MAENPTLKEKISTIISKVSLNALLPLFSKGPKHVVDPEKELRFTRAGQALHFYSLSVVFFSISMAIFILSTQDWTVTGPMLAEPFWIWLCIPGMILCFIFLRLGIWCTRHAYVILSPLGIEIFPFFRAQKNLQIVYWGEVADVDIDDRQMVLHFTEEKQSGIVASLSPISRKRRPLLQKALLGMMKNRLSK